jgi:Fe-S-cluster containining protein
VIPPSIFSDILLAWSFLGPRWQAYQLVTPDSPAFLCQPGLCNAHCCRAFSVALGDREVERMQRLGGLIPADFLELEDGRPVRLPLVQPYLLARASDRCTLLGDDLRCTRYHGRPDACRLYPHFAVAFDLETRKPARPGPLPLPELVGRALADRLDGSVVPLLLRHVECPGFTGAPLGDLAWERLFRETAALQAAVETPDSSR